MKQILLIVLATAQVVFAANIHCASCAKKVQENISFEKGVKDLEVSVEKRTVTVTYNTAKTDTVKLGKAMAKIGFPAKVISYKEK